MALEFPANPAAQTPINVYGPDSTPDATTNGVTYVWNSDGYWVADVTGDVDLSGFYNKTESDDRFVNVDGDTMTGDLTVPSLNGGPLAGFRNQIINGDFRIWQRGLSGSVGNRTHTADRWYSPNPSSYSQSTIAPDGFAQSYKYTSGADGHLYQTVELDSTGTAGRFANGSTWTLSFYVKSDGTSDNVYAMCDFTDDASGLNVVAVYDGSGDTVTASGTWQRVTRTFTISASPNATNLCFRVMLRCDSRTSALYYAGVQLEPGPVATPFEYRPIGTELALCQRYFASIDLGTNATATGQVYKTAGGTGAYPLLLQYPVIMRVKPTVDVTGVTARSASGAGATPSGKTVSTSRVENTGVYLGVTDLSQNTTGILDFGGVFKADAEL